MKWPFPRSTTALKGGTVLLFLFMSIGLYSRHFHMHCIARIAYEEIQR